jgi:predicted nuclease with TOPRIM domain
MATVASTVTVNAAFLQEIKDDNIRLHALLGETRLVAEQLPVLHDDVSRFCDLINELRDQIAMHFALEEAYGYFDDAVCEAPRLSERAGELRAEHGELFVTLCDLVDDAERLRYNHNRKRLRRMVSCRFVDFHQQLQDHESRENELIFDAFDDDIGVGD